LELAVVLARLLSAFKAPSPRMALAVGHLSKRHNALHQDEATPAFHKAHCIFKKYLSLSFADEPSRLCGVALALANIFCKIGGRNFLTLYRAAAP